VKQLVLNGWDVHVEKTKILERGENGSQTRVDGWALVLTEKIPPTGNVIRYEFGRNVRDFIVRELTGGVVLAGGDLPSIP
jgi:hypothetical protein